MAAACAASMSANPSAPRVVPAKPALAPTKKWRRESSMFIDRFSLERVPPPGDVQFRTALTARLDRRIPLTLKRNFRGGPKSKKHSCGKGAFPKESSEMPCNLRRLRKRTFYQGIASGYHGIMI